MKKIFTLIAVAAMALTAGAQEVGLFDYSTAYEDGQSISTANAKLTLGDDMKGWKVSATKITEGGFLNAFGQTVTVTTDDGDKEQFSAITLAGQNNPKDEAASGKGSGINCAEGKTSAHLPLNGTYYIFQPTASGPVQIGINLNADKAFYLLDATNAEMVHDDSKDKDYLNVALPDANLHNYVIKNADGEEVALEDDSDGKGGKIVAEKTTGVLEFEAEAGKTYYFFCAGSKLGCFGYVFNAAAAEEKFETTLWEGTAVVDGWANQPTLLSDGGAELKNVKAKAGDVLRFYMTAPDNEWEVELTKGHWDGLITRWAAYDHGGTNKDGTPRVYNVVDLSKGYVELELTQELLDYALTSQGWGGVFILNGNGNVTVTKLTIMQGEVVGPEPQGETESIIDRFTYTWNEAESLTHNADGSITFNSVSWGGLAAWLKGETEPTDWSGYQKIVFEFAEPTTVSTQILIGGTDASAWGNPGITSLECLFEGHDMTNVEQVALQTSDPTTLTITAIYLVKKATDGIKNTVSQKMDSNAPIYNLAGVRVNKDYKGIVIQNGKKFIQK